MFKIFLRAWLQIFECAKSTASANVLDKMRDMYICTQNITVKFKDIEVISSAEATILGDPGHILTGI